MFSCRFLYSTTAAASTAAAIITPTAIPAFFPPLIPPPPTSSPAWSASSPDRISSLLGTGAGGGVVAGAGTGEDTSGGGVRGGRGFSGGGERDGVESGEGAGGDWRGPPGTGEGELDGATKEKERSAVERRTTTEISNAGGEGERAAAAAMGEQHSQAADWRSGREAGGEPDFCGLFIYIGGRH
ncbi:hypothetical protein GW17_00039530 [Ensete ventricosum]|nr:hypothetical protein GW17_00039530 [Ensete ventricosum]